MGRQLVLVAAMAMLLMIEFTPGCHGKSLSRVNEDYATLARIFPGFPGWPRKGLNSIEKQGAEEEALSRVNEDYATLARIFPGFPGWPRKGLNSIEKQGAEDEERDSETNADNEELLSLAERVADLVKERQKEV